MGIGTILIGLALLTVIIALVISPLLEPRRPAVEPPNLRESLQAEREGVIRAIRELDLDFRTRKLNDDDYKTLREAQVQRGAAVLRELDQLEASDDIDAQIEDRIAHIRREAAECPSCGMAVRSSDRFCANCGYRFEGEDATSKQEGKRP